VVLASGSNRSSSLEFGPFKNTAGITDISGLLGIIREGAVPARVAVVMDVACEQDRSVSSLVLTSALHMAGRLCSHVTVFCNNVRVAAVGLESLYRRARNAGVVFVKSEKKPVVGPEIGMVTVEFDDTVASASITEDFDLVVMADFEATEDRRGLADAVDLLKTGPEDVLQYDNIWLLPALTNRPGVFVIGGARGNSEYREALTDALAVADDVHDLLKDGKIEIAGDAAVVDSGKCVLCLTCLRICPHGAISIDDEKNAAAVSVLSCRRCGICVSECPAKAITMPGYTDEELSADIGEQPRVTVFACENSALPAADLAGLKGFGYGADVELVRVPCAGRMDPSTVLTALERGAGKVLVVGCHPESCKYLTGSSRSQARFKRLAAMLGKVGIDPSRVTFGGIASVEPSRFIEYVTAVAPGNSTETAGES